MKKNIFKKALMVLLLVVISMATYAQTEPPLPPDPYNQGVPPVGGGGAPIGSGLTMLLLMGAGYGMKKIYYVKKTNKLT